MIIEIANSEEIVRLCGNNCDQRLFLLVIIKIFLICVVIFYHHRHNPDQSILIMLVIRDEESEDIFGKLRPAADWIENALQV